MSTTDLDRPRRPALDAVGPAEPVERKEKVLHTRVPDSLDRHIKRRARGLGMSVSTVVRNVLLSTFGLVEDIVTDSTNIALAMTGQPVTRAGGHRPAPDGHAAEVAPVLAWQEAVLNLNAVCERCNAILRRGTRAALGVRDGSGPRAILCRACVRRLEGKPGGERAPR
jgi:hypothetical protein